MRRFAPETAFVRTIFVMNAKTPVSNGHPDVLWEERGAQFDRWLNSIKAEAWEQGSLDRADRGLGIADNPTRRTSHEHPRHSRSAHGEASVE